MIRFFLLLSLFSFSARAEMPLLFLVGEAQQGETIFGHADPSSELTLNGAPVPRRDDGWFVVGIGRNDTEPLEFSVKSDKGDYIRKMTVTERKWRVQRIDGLEKNKVSPSPEEQARIGKEFKAIADARKKKTNAVFPLCFIKPVEGRISSVYGSQRILNGEPKSPHNALDYAAKTGTPITAPADGVVTLAYDEMFLTGKTVLIDHGLGVTTSYSHLSKMSVKEGDIVKRGDKIGEVGATGRATGPHLHWVVSIREKRVDPQVFLENAAKFCDTDDEKQERKH